MKSDAYEMHCNRVQRKGCQLLNEEYNRLHQKRLAKAWNSRPLWRKILKVDPKKENGNDFFDFVKGLFFNIMAWVMVIIILGAIVVFFYNFSAIVDWSNSFGSGSGDSSYEQFDYLY